MAIKYNTEVTLPETQRTKLDCVHREYVEVAIYRTQQRTLRKFK
jgi:hypothetical protein